MTKAIISVATAFAFVGLAASASAQQSASSSSMQGHSARAENALPEQCRKAGADMPQSGNMDMGNMPMQGMTEAQRANMDAMMKMRPPMMAGIRAKDPDVAFVCGMIPHHQGAIDMAQFVLKYGDNPETRRMAEKVIKDQRREIDEMTAWLKKNVR